MTRLSRLLPIVLGLSLTHIPAAEAQVHHPSAASVDKARTNWSVEQETRQRNEQASRSLIKRGDGTFGHGPVVITAFIDRSDTASAQEIPFLAALVTRSGDVTVDIKELPRIDEKSVAMARIMVAARLLDDTSVWRKLEWAWVSTPSVRTPDGMKAELRRLGVSNIDEKAYSGQVDTYLHETRDLGDSIGIQGTPVMLVGPKLLTGLRTSDQLLSEVRAVRAQYSAETH